VLQVRRTVANANMLLGVLTFIPALTGQVLHDPAGTSSQTQSCGRCRRASATGCPASTGWCTTSPPSRRAPSSGNRAHCSRAAIWPLGWRHVTWRKGDRCRAADPQSNFRQLPMGLQAQQAAGLSASGGGGSTASGTELRLDGRHTQWAASAA
jgi:hypothetical protein